MFHLSTQAKVYFKTTGQVHEALTIGLALLSRVSPCPAMAGAPATVARREDSR